MTRFLVNPLLDLRHPIVPARREVRAFHQRMDGYAVTPLHDLPDLARQLGIAQLWAKDESMRFGLPAFKMLGASWATVEILRDRVERGDAETRELVAATDGNHGRAVARMARSLAIAATIFVPAAMATERKSAIAAEGATVVDVAGTYDDALAAAAAHADGDHHRALVSDTWWPGHDIGPRAATEGYSTIFGEIDEQGARPDVVVVQIGVGALAAAAVGHYMRLATVVGVEPDSAACALVSAEAGTLTEVPGPHPSVMAGLNCGIPSAVAWPAVSAGVTAFVSVPDEFALEATASLRAAGIEAGETGAAGLAGLLAIARGAEEWRAQTRLRSTSRVLIIITEGDTARSGG